METPDQLLARLDTMGEQRVCMLMEKNYFEPRAVALVQGWLTRKQEARQPEPPNPVEEELEKARALARQAIEAAAKADQNAARADERARRANRVALAAVAMGSSGLLVSVLILFVLARG